MRLITGLLVVVFAGHPWAQQAPVADDGQAFTVFLKARPANHSNLGTGRTGQIRRPRPAGSVPRRTEVPSGTTPLSRRHPRSDSA
jgi:hypothetical protein